MFSLILRWRDLKNTPRFPLKSGDKARKGPGLAADQKKTLEDIRQRIDEIDDAILALIGERMQAVYDVRAAKAGLENGQSTAMRPGREAVILRRLVAARGEGVPAGLVARLWREVIASATRLQGPLPLHVADDAGSGESSDLAREHFGVGGEMTRHETASQVIDAVSGRITEVGVVAATQDGVAEWVDHLLSKEAGTPQVIAALPFVSADAMPKGLVVGHADAERTGDDSTVLALKCMSGNHGRAFSALQEAGLEGAVLAQGQSWSMFAVTGWIDAHDARLEALNALPDVEDARIAGAYANPIRLTESE